jgi:xanthine dehydrogenase YagR molybdenum-binding subunit
MPWPTERKYLGKSTPRVEAPAKVTGRAKYTTDVAPPGVLYGAILRSKWPAAHIRSVNVDKAKAAPGIKAAIKVNDGEFDVRYYGDEIAAVAGTTKQAVLDALALIEVSAETKAFVVTEVEAMQTDAPRVVADRPNLGQGKVNEAGDVNAAFAASAAVVEGIYSTQVEIHHMLEPHGHTTMWEGDELTSYSSTQGIFGCRGGFANGLKLQANKVRVICEHMGGGFGAKFNPGAEGILSARLSQAAGAPVKLVLTRFEQALAVGNRPSSFQKIKLGADAEGKLTAVQLDSFGTAGYGVGATTGGGSGSAAFPAPYIYKPAVTRVRQSSVAINAGQACPMRAPGHPPASAGIEAALDDLAAKLGVDPVQIRLKNDPSETRRQQYQLGAEKFGWKQKFQKPGSAAGPVKVGVGCAGNAWNSGTSNRSRAELEVHNDGTVEVRVGMQDLGTGSRTMVQVITAEMLGIEPALVTSRVGDTRFPNSVASGGSTTSAAVAPTIVDACEKAVEELKKLSGIDDPRGANWKSACAKIGSSPISVQGAWREGLSSGGRALNQGGVQFAEVEVDTETGFVKVRKVLIVQDVGLVLNKLTLESQINGGIIMGLGYALYEQRVMDRRSGVVLNPNFETYKLPGPADIPEIEIVLQEDPAKGVMGVGEPCTVPTASAIANAVANALGVRVPSLPITPNKVLAALGKAPVTDRASSLQQELEQAFTRVAEMPVTPHTDEALA